MVDRAGKAAGDNGVIGGSDNSADTCFGGPTRSGSSCTLRIAIVGAESTGKTALAQALADRLAELTGLRCAAVGEWLRQWCDDHGRTPHPDEQRAIAEHQQALINAAARTHDVVVCDTTPLMTAVYSAMLFGDDAITAYAVAQQRHCDLTLLTALDLPWVADGLQRDGPQVREPVDARVRTLLIQHALPWALVAGSGEARLDAALNAVAPLLRRRAAPETGLFTRLAEREAALPYGGGEGSDEAGGWRWTCDCDVPECEHRLRAASR